MGYALSEEFKINNLDSSEFIKNLEDDLSNNENVILKKNFSIVGVHDHSYLLGLENFEVLESEDHSSIRHRLWRIRTKHLILATGAIERPLFLLEMIYLELFYLLQLMSFISFMGYRKVIE